MVLADSAPQCPRSSCMSGLRWFNRKGELDAEEFLRQFRTLCGGGGAADAVLDDLASLLPLPEQQLALRAAVEAEGGPAAIPDSAGPVTGGMPPRTRQQATRQQTVVPSQLPDEAAGKEPGAAQAANLASDERPQFRENNSGDDGCDPGNAAAPVGSESTSSGCATCF